MFIYGIDLCPFPECEQLISFSTTSATKTGKKSIGSHCEPNPIIKAVECYEARKQARKAKDFVKDCGFGGILEINVTKLCSIETIVVMMDKYDVSSDDESFTIVISNENQIKVTSKVVQRILGIPARDLLMDDKNWSKEYYNFWKVLKDKGYDVVTCVKSKGKMQENKKNLFRCVIEVHEICKR